MTFDITSRREDGYVFVAAVGPVSEESLAQLGEEVKGLCDEANVDRAIIDVGGMEGALPPERLYYTTIEFINTVGLARRVAYINPPAHWIPEDDEFSRNVAQNRSGSLEMFATLEEAIAWLDA
jgi:hypothetical protein